MAKSKLNSILEENLCKINHNYRVSFGKSCKEHKEKNAITNAWQGIAKSLECIRNGEYHSILKS